MWFATDFRSRAPIIFLIAPVALGLSLGAPLRGTRWQPQLKRQNAGVGHTTHEDDAGALLEREDRAKMKVEIFYESMCPFCMQFVSTDVQQFWGHEQLREQVELHLYPYGNAGTSGVAGAYYFQCQHGDMECRGNLIEACATQLLDGPGQYVPFIGCMASTAQTYPMDDSARACAQQMNINLDPVYECASSAAGNDFMAQIGRYSSAMTAGREYVPWVLVDGQHYREADMGRQLSQVVCSALAQRGESMPPVCTQQAAYGVAAARDTIVMRGVPTHHGFQENLLPEQEGGVCWTPGKEPVLRNITK